MALSSKGAVIANNYNVTREPPQRCDNYVVGRFFLADKTLFPPVHSLHPPTLPVPCAVALTLTLGVTGFRSGCDARLRSRHACFCYNMVSYLAMELLALCSFRDPFTRRGAHSEPHSTQSVGWHK